MKIQHNSNSKKKWNKNIFESVTIWIDSYANLSNKMACNYYYAQCAFHRRHRKIWHYTIENSPWRRLIHISLCGYTMQHILSYTTLSNEERKMENRICYILTYYQMCLVLLWWAPTPQYFFILGHRICDKFFLSMKCAILF